MGFISTKYQLSKSVGNIHHLLKLQWDKFLTFGRVLVELKNLDKKPMILMLELALVDYIYSKYQ